MVEDSRAVVRLDNDSPLSVVGSRYEAIQNDAFADIFDRVCGEFRAAYVNGGEFDGGRRVFVQAELPDQIRVLSSDDTVKKMLTFITSHDATTPTTAGGSNIRIVCQNTFMMNLKQLVRDVRIRHTASASGRIEQAEEIIKSQIQYHNAVEVKVNQLASTRVTDAQMEQLVRGLFNVSQDATSDDIPTRTKNNMDSLTELWTSGTGIDASNRGTAWAAYNAVTEFADWRRLVRGEDEDSSRRIQSNMLGTSAAFKAKGEQLIDTLFLAS